MEVGMVALAAFLMGGDARLVGRLVSCRRGLGSRWEV